jgi:hypothetical protein
VPFGPPSSPPTNHLLSRITSAMEASPIYFVDSLWICYHAYVMDMFWICYGYVLDMLWICCGYVLDMLWICCGTSVEILRIPTAGASFTTIVTRRVQSRVGTRMQQDAQQQNTATLVLTHHKLRLAKTHVRVRNGPH